MRKLVFLILAVLGAVFGSRALQNRRGAGSIGGDGGNLGGLLGGLGGEQPSTGGLHTTDGKPVQDV